MSERTHVRVAILGGGLAGVAIFHGLLQAPNLDVHIFESAPAFREQGQGIGFNENAISALTLLGLRERLEAAQAVRMNQMRCMIAQGKDTGNLSFHLDVRKRGTWICQRAQFLSELLKGVDEARLHPGKKMTKLNQDSTGVLVTFEDGTTHECNILIGADGIYSTVRKYVVGHDHPSANPKFAGWWTIWTLMPFEKAQNFLGKDIMDPKNPRQYCWCGDGEWIMHDALSDNTLSQCIIVRREKEDQEIDWNKTATKEELLENVSRLDNPIGNNMVHLVTDGQDAPLKMVPLQHHIISAPHYVKGSVAIAGDAADATTPWKGSGGGQSLEDAWILSQVFKHVKTVDDARAALKAYEKTNQPRRQRLVKASYDTGLTFCGCIPEVGLDAEKMKARLEKSWEWIVEVDLEKQAANAVKAMEEFRLSP